MVNIATGRVFNEIKAVELLTGVECYPLGAGGLGAAKGSLTLGAVGRETKINSLLKIIEEVKDKINISGAPGSLKECYVGCDSCKFHYGCGYKKGVLLVMRELKNKVIKLGAITIGQSPRDDMVPEIEEVLGKEFEIIQCGALDDFTYQEIIDRFSPTAGEDVLVSKLRDGREVIFAERHIIPLLQNCIDKLATQGIEAILMLCTGRFPEFNYSGLIIKPQMVLHKLVAGSIGDKTLGIMVPDENQIEQIKQWWNESGLKVELKAASPYQLLEKIVETAKEFSSDVEVIFLDCMGFTREMKELVSAASGKKVILPRIMIAAVVRELFI